MGGRYPFVLNKPTHTDAINLYLGRLNSHELPAEIDLGDLYPEMQELWERSVQDIAQGRVVEWGGTLVLDREGKLRLINKASGTADAFDAKTESGEGKVFVGTFHTHPYEDGTIGMAFSGVDIATAINGEEILSLVQSGEHVFALVRTERTVSGVSVSALKREVDLLYESYLSASVSYQEALILANLHACKRYGLAFYQGKVFGKLMEVFPS